MKIISSAFSDGIILDKYGGRSGFFIGPMYGCSFPMDIADTPEGTETFAIIFDDPDAVGPQGFVWVHWLVAGLRSAHLEENASRTDPGLVQGVTSWYPRRLDDPLESCYYGGPNPPDRVHEYVLKVYALDFDPCLKKGFTREELIAAMDGHILDTAEMHGRYSPRTV